MTTPTPDPLALAEEAEKAICNRVRGKDRDYGPLTNREYQDILALASALRAAQEENARLREALEEREGDMHLRIRAGYDKTVADSWRQENTRLREALGELFEENERMREEVNHFSGAAMRGLDIAERHGVARQQAYTEIFQPQTAPAGKGEG